MVGAVGVASLVGFAPRAEASTHVASFYRYANYFGVPRSYDHPSNGYFCTPPTTDIDLAVNNSTLFSAPYDNDISSFDARGSTNCVVKLFDNYNWTGASYGWKLYAATLPSTINNLASSAYMS